MGISRLRKLIENGAFTLAENLVAMLIAGISSMILLSALAMFSNFSAKAQELSDSISKAAARLYNGKADGRISLLLPVRIETSDGYIYEDINGADGVELLAADIGICKVTQEIHLYYYISQ